MGKKEIGRNNSKNQSEESENRILFWAKLVLLVIFCLMYYAMSHDEDHTKTTAFNEVYERWGLEE